MQLTKNEEKKLPPNNKKACKTCKKLSLGPICDGCGSNSLSSNWVGLVAIIDLDSELANLLKIKNEGEYAVFIP